MASSTETKLLNALNNYVLDIKPYHTKIKNLSSELTFNDSFNISVTDSQFVSFYFQNIWDINSIGGFKLLHTSSGNDADRFIKIPNLIFPRFSLNDSISYNQTPVGDDPATFDFTDANNDDFPDSDSPWLGDPSNSHFTGSDQLAVIAPITSIYTVITSSVLNSGTYQYYFNVHFSIDPTEANTYGFGRDYNNPSDGVQIFVLLRNGIYIRLEATTSNNIDYIATGVYGGAVGISSSFTPSVEDLLSLPTPTAFNRDLFCEFGESKFTRHIFLYWTKTGRYQVPFHQGSRVYINEVEQEFITDYIVDSSRSWIQLVGSYYENFPSSLDKIDVNIFKTDRLSVAFNNPFDYDISRGFDEYGYDDLPYDTDGDNPTITATDKFTLTINHSLPDGASVTFFNSNNSIITYKATLTINNVDVSTVNGDIWEISAIGNWNFKVQQVYPVISAIDYAYFKLPFNNGRISFTIEPTWFDYYLSQDPNSYEPLIGIPNDRTHFLVNLFVRTEHGVIVDPVPSIHAPVEMISFGKIEKVKDDSLNITADIDKEYYRFVLNSIPPRGTYIELKIEQQSQFNHWFNMNITDSLVITQVIQDSEEITSNVRTTETTPEGPTP